MTKKLSWCRQRRDAKGHRVIESQDGGWGIADDGDAQYPWILYFLGEWRADKDKGRVYREVTAFASIQEAKKYAGKIPEIELSLTCPQCGVPRSLADACPWCWGCPQCCSDDDCMMG